MLIDQRKPMRTEGLTDKDLEKPHIIKTTHHDDARTRPDAFGSLLGSGAGKAIAFMDMGTAPTGKSKFMPRVGLGIGASAGGCIDKEGAIYGPRNSYAKSIDYRGANFSGCFLVGIDFSRITLTNANFEGANLAYANFAGANLTYANFKGAMLDGVKYTSSISLGQAWDAESADWVFYREAMAQEMREYESFMDGEAKRAWQGLKDFFSL
jgi:Pentapeptide repeats (8 copies)